jgi:hypothetical protein
MANGVLCHNLLKDHGSKVLPLKALSRTVYDLVWRFGMGDLFSIPAETPVRHVNPKCIRSLRAAVLAGTSRTELEKQERADAFPNAPRSCAENFRE